MFADFTLPELESTLKLYAAANQFLSAGQVRLRMC